MNKDGFWSMVAATKSPPFEPPWIAVEFGEPILFSCKNLAAYAKSSKTFCLLNSIPSSCHFAPYSEPPLMLAIAITPPWFIQAKNLLLKPGKIEISKPPYPYNKIGVAAFILIPVLWLTWIGILVPSFDS